MSTLNPDQFGERKPGVFQGERGEPDPNEYNREQDWLQDHRRFVSRRNEGKAYNDPAMQQIKSAAKQQDDSTNRQERQVIQQRSQTRRDVINGLRGMNRAMGRMGMKKRRKIW